MDAGPGEAAARRAGQAAQRSVELAERRQRLAQGRLRAARGCGSERPDVARGSGT